MDLTKDQCIKETERFLRERMDACTYYEDKQDEKEYRIEHSYRVANIGIEIARKEGLNEFHMTLGCLLHDIGYSLVYPPEEHIHHGRYGAKIARPFLLDLGLDAQDVNEICYGIAIHVDDKADFEGERTKLALTFGDADNIDRFNVFRIYETLRWKEFEKMTLANKQEHVDKVIHRLTAYLKDPLATESAGKMWRDVVSYQLEYYKRLESQLRNSRFV